MLVNVSFISLSINVTFSLANVMEEIFSSQSFKDFQHGTYSAALLCGSLVQHDVGERVYFRYSVRKLK